jgi:hypothetical protein
MTSFEDLCFDLACAAALPNTAQIGRPVSANSRNAVTTFATLRMKQIRTAITHRCIGCVDDWTSRCDKESDGAAKEDKARA